MKIIPVQPQPAAAAETNTDASRRTFGNRIPSRRTFGNRIP